MGIKRIQETGTITAADGRSSDEPTGPTSFSAYVELVTAVGEATLLPEKSEEPGSVDVQQ